MIGKQTAYFERAIFISWYCRIASCKYCHMMTLKKKARKNALRSMESIISEAILAKKCKWKIEFISSGYQSHNPFMLLKIVKAVHEIMGEKVTLNVGVLKEKELKLLVPHVSGLCAAIETINPMLHKKLCPDKPIKPLLKMFKLADKYNLKKSITIILGLGETKKDINRLHNFIKKHNISKITLYSLNPIKGTMFEHKQSPSKEYMALWISKTRMKFPKIDIVAGIWADKINYIPLLLNSGANSITKFPVIRLFGSKKAHLFSESVKKAGFTFKSNLVKMPKITKQDIDSMAIEKRKKDALKKVLAKYLRKMARHIKQT